ncbi:amidohydrolase [Evansella vedderi]|uniref:Amidohydrolase n=1 Tax=Evansella vedderi TaxID=38282 RepID=A0ABT9ZND8_9BACI|nr:M20 peptidase aminoacylase family protein [Evansella vedderi]MDQ0252709.1 amidohydrolase [Evansella vedderi]
MKELMEQIKTDLMDIFTHLHENPEVSWKEFETTKYLASFLEKQGAKVRTFSECTGVIADIGEGFPVVAVRADIDALWQEVDGQFQANHSCGHDAHMTIAIGVLMTLKRLSSLPKGTIRFIFQPAEEKGDGALTMVDKGVVDDVDYLYGVHLRPEMELSDGYASPAIIHGGARFLKGTIQSDDAHGARPHLGKNAIEVGASFVSMLNGIHLDPLVPYSVKMTSFHAGGESANIIPGSATFSLDLRAQQNDTMEQLVTKVKDIAASLEKLYNTSIQLETAANVAAAEVNREAQAFMERGIIEALRNEKLHAPLVSTGGDDFHFYTIKRPHLKATMLGLGCGLTPGLHHPKMTFNREAMLDAVHILTITVLETLKEGKK